MDSVMECRYHFPHMRNLLVLGSLMIGLVSGATHATGSRVSEFGLGVILGQPTGITGKLWFSKKAAFDVGLAYNFSNSFLVYGDFLWHFPEFFRTTVKNQSDFLHHLTPYFGVGGVLGFASSGRTGSGSASAGVRIPLGFEWRPANAPLGVFLEVAPGITIAPATAGLIEGGIGIRYYF